MKKQSKKHIITYSIGNKSNNVLNKIQHKKIKTDISIISWAFKFICFDFVFAFHRKTFLTA